MKSIEDYIEQLGHPPSPPQGGSRTVIPPNSKLTLLNSSMKSLIKNKFKMIHLPIFYKLKSVRSIPLRGL